MEINFSDLKEPEITDGSENEHISHANDLTDELQVIDELFLNLPLELLKAAQEVSSVQNEQNEWVRGFTHHSEEETYQVRLVGTYENGEKVRWEFFLTSDELNIEDQLFVSGLAGGDGVSGSWTFYNLQNTDSPPEIAQIDWELPEKGEREIELAITSDLSDMRGDHLTYSVNSSETTVAYYDAQDEVTTEVQVNKRNNIGYVIAEDYHEGRQACWNKQFMDVPCGEL